MKRKVPSEFNQSFRHSLIIKVWSEVDPAEIEDPLQWRGSVQHVKEPEVHYFTRLDQIPELIARLVTPDQSVDADQE